MSTFHIVDYSFLNCRDTISASCVCRDWYDRSCRHDNNTNKNKNNTSAKGLDVVFLAASRLQISNIDYPVVKSVVIQSKYTSFVRWIRKKALVHQKAQGAIGGRARREQGAGLANIRMLLPTSPGIGHVHGSVVANLPISISQPRHTIMPVSPGQSGLFTGRSRVWLVLSPVPHKLLAQHPYISLAHRKH